jgi:cell volume regulation protein A
MMVVITNVDEILVAISTIIILGYVGEAIFRATRIPEVIILMAIGVIIGPFGNILPSVYINVLRNFTPLISSLVLIMIMFNNGTAIKPFSKDGKGYLGIIIAFMDIAVSAIGLAILMHYFFEWPLIYGGIFGVIIGETSSVIVLPLVKKLKIPKDTYNTLIMETTFNSVFAILAFYLLIVFITGSHFSAYSYVQYVIDYMSVPFFIGLFAGIGWLILRNTIKIASTYVASLSIAMLIYGFVDFFGGSAIVAVLIFAIILGNDKELSKLMKLKNLSSNKKSRIVEKEFEFIIRTFFFVLLGIIAIISLEYFIISIIASLVLMVLRYVEVNSIMIKENKINRNLVYSMSQKGLGVAVLSSIFYSMNVPYSGEIFSLAFMVIIITNILSAVLVKWSSNSISLAN